jgi:hypothetical protein
MSKKLLSENEVRRFMKLATIEPLANSFVEKAGPVLKEQMDDLDDEGGMPGDEGPDDAGLPPADMDMDMGAEDPGGMMDMGEAGVTRLVDAIADAIEEVTGVGVERVGAEEGLEGEESGEMDMGDMPPADAMAPDAAAGPEDEEALQLQERAMKLRNYIRNEIRSLMEEVASDSEEEEETVEEVRNLAQGDSGLAAKGSETGHGVAEKGDPGPHKMSDLKRSKKDEGGNSASVVAEDRKVAEITRRVAARLLAASKSS